MEKQFYVICNLCNKKFEILNASHMQRKHGITVSAYKKAFGLKSNDLLTISLSMQKRWAIKEHMKKDKGYPYIRRWWNDKRDNVLRKNYETHDRYQLARILKTTPYAVDSRRAVLGLKKHERLDEKVKENVINYANKHYKNETVKEIADKFVLKYSQVDHLLHYAGIRKS